ncbi:MAG: CBS domain-containing protein [Anaerolinea sp.]|nr:CBS domain-containing protein [Anaerolinea sp.]
MGQHIILCHDNADFDAVASVLAAAKLYPDAVPLLPQRINRNVQRFLALYAGGLPFVRYDDYAKNRRIAQVTLVDTNRPPERIRGIKPDTPVHIIDHHPLTRELDANETFEGEIIGANTTLLVEKLQAAGTALTSLEATLLALGLYEDTGALTYRTTSPRDIRAAAWLLEQGASLDNIRRFLEPPLDERQQALFETLVTSMESRSIQGYPILVGTAVLDSYLSELSSVAHKLRDTLDPAALFLLIEMPKSLQLVCRSTDDAINVGEIARRFGGGGHERAAASTVRGMTRAQALQTLWGYIYDVIQPPVTVADLMSHGVQTVDTSAKLDAVIRRMRRIGHEGFPVVKQGQIVGLLTRRDADRAVEHGLGGLTVGEVMASGTVTLLPSDSVTLLEQKMVESGWGQIPVVDSTGKLIGIVTRTDLIKHWVKTHPARPQPEAPHLTPDDLRAVFGESAAHLIEVIAAHAQERGLSLYMVGGVVRDLLLRRRNLDLDFVVEGDAIQFAESLVARYGAEMSSYTPFGTAKWRLHDGTLNKAVGVAADLPDHVDFATARSEFYQYPTALPTVYSGSIKLDLARRDFTINTLAVQLSPGAGRILDFFGGIADLTAGRIRALHSLSFVDDPTRILRAVRFERRLGFTIDPRTAELIQTALPMLERITGERVRNELTLLLKEREPELSFLLMQQRGILAAIHPQFVIGEGVAQPFQRARAAAPFATLPPFEFTDLLWLLLLHETQDSGAVQARLMFHGRFDDALSAIAKLTAPTFVELCAALTAPSQIVPLLDELYAKSDLGVFAASLILDEPLARTTIQRYVEEWRHIRPVTTGKSLQALGLKPGPQFGDLLARLRLARIDGIITTDEQEDRLLKEWVRHDGVKSTDVSG